MCISVVTHQTIFQMLFFSINLVSFSSCWTWCLSAAQNLAAMCSVQHLLWTNTRYNKTVNCSTMYFTSPWYVLSLEWNGCWLFIHKCSRLLFIFELWFLSFYLCWLLSINVHVSYGLLSVDIVLALKDCMFFFPVDSCVLDVVVYLLIKCQ